MSDVKEDSFYIGYMPDAPPELARRLRVIIICLMVAVPLIGAAVAVSQAAFAPAVFEFGVPRAFEGVIRENPYPQLEVTRPGQGGAPLRVSRYYLVSFGKFGGQTAVAGLDGKRVKLRGALVYRDDQTMIELEAGSLEVQESFEVGPDMENEPLGAVVLRGEIVDSKCFLGVMNPGALKAHKACAVRCISGGIPPVLLVRAGSGVTRYFLLTDEQGGMVNEAVLHLVADPVEVKGELERKGGLLILRCDPASIKRL